MNEPLSIAYIAKNRAFAHAKIYQEKNSGGYDWNFPQLVFFFTNRGYFINRTSKQKFIIIRVLDNIVREVGKKELIEEITFFLSEVDFEKGKLPHHIDQFARKKMKDAVSDDFLIQLPEKKVAIRRDKKDAMQLYFSNCIVKITCNKVTTHPYTELNGLIWESQILDREYKLIADENKQSDFKKFIFNISNQEPKRFFSICSVLGFLIHNFKSPAYCPAIILNDEVISDNPEGGTGKGLIVKAVEQFIKTVVIEGKTFNFDKNFVYQDVNADTMLLSFQDVNRTFNFERLFSVLTDGISVEKKGLQSVHYDFYNSPKIAITTNYALRGDGSSHRRRKFELEISQYYNDTKKPEHEFEKMFFIEWDAEDFLLFDSFMIDCAQYYLNNGLVAQELINLPEKRLLAELSAEFLEFIEHNILEPNEKIQMIGFYQKFAAQYPRSKIVMKTFYKWVIMYCEFHKIVCIKQKTNGLWFFIF
jgi:hypothetical protein